MLCNQLLNCVISPYICTLKNVYIPLSSTKHIVIRLHLYKIHPNQVILLYVCIDTNSLAYPQREATQHNGQVHINTHTHTLGGAAVPQGPRLSLHDDWDSRLGDDQQGSTSNHILVRNTLAMSLHCITALWGWLFVCVCVCVCLWYAPARLEYLL